MGAIQFSQEQIDQFTAMQEASFLKLGIKMYLVKQGDPKQGAVLEAALLRSKQQGFLVKNKFATIKEIMDLKLLGEIKSKNTIKNWIKQGRIQSTEAIKGEKDEWLIVKSAILRLNPELKK